jgi:hypothetical protein
MHLTKNIHFKKFAPEPSASGSVSVAAGIELFCTEKRVTAGDDKRHHNAVIFVELCHQAADFDNRAHRLMAKDVAFLIPSINPS